MCWRWRRQRALLPPLRPLRLLLRDGGDGGGDGGAQGQLLPAGGVSPGWNTGTGKEEREKGMKMQDSPQICLVL